jgi:alpha-galactosidase
MQYCGGHKALSYIDRDKISLSEIVGHLRDHFAVAEGTLLHWLFHEKELENGIRVLNDDKACQDMSNCIMEGGVADIFVEDVPDQVQIQSESREKVDKESLFVK